MSNKETGMPLSSTEHTTMDGFVVRQITSHHDFERFLPSLCRLLQACVNPCPATSALAFLAPLSDADATSYWTSVGAQLSEDRPLLSLFVVTRGHTALLTSASAPSPVVLGTIQVACSAKQTHAHRAEILKLLVSPDERGHGLGRLLMRHVENYTVDTLGKSMLLLDTATQTPAREFYLKSGWTEWGLCPSYASYADGRLGDCSFFYKVLQPLP